MNEISRRRLLKYVTVAGIGGLIATRLPSIARASQQASLSQTIADAVSRFLDTLSEEQRTKASYAFTDNERFRWHWTTPGGFPRHGLPLREMNDDQKAAAFALLQASVSELGYQKALDIMSLQNDLGNDPQAYYVTIFGTAGDPAGWGWRWEGHHLSRNFTVIGDQVEVMPFFLGSWPTENDAGLRAMAREEDAARELVNSLEGDARNAAIFQANTLTNHLTSNNPRVTPLGQLGVQYSALNTDQQGLVTEIINAYLGVLPAELTTAHYNRITEAGLDNILFGWAGSLEARRPQYYRLQGPTFLLEFDNSRNRGTHVHSVWRDFTNDFGYNLLG